MQPFANIRVIDMTHVIAGPFCTYQLAVLGADVIKIESVDSPDMSRQDGVDVEEAKRGLGMLFMTQAANKRSIALDLKTLKGQEVARKLIDSADVVVENFRPGALSNLGLGYDAVRETNPTLIYCSLTGYGQDGELSSRTAYDNVIQAISGLMASTGQPSCGPVKVGPPVLDYGTGIQGAFAIAAALFQRSQTGEGQRIDIAMLDAALMLTGTNITQLQETGESPSLNGNSNVDNAGYGCYETADGLLMLGAYTGEQHANAWKVLGDAAHGESLRTLKRYELVAHAASDRDHMTTLLMQDTAANWELRFNEARVPAAEVRGVSETMDLAHLASRGVVQRVDTHRGQLDLPVASFKYQHDGPKLNSGPPLHGEHSRELLEETGYDTKQIDDLIASGVTREAL